MVLWPKSHLTCINKVIFLEETLGKKAAATDMTQASSKIKSKQERSHLQNVFQHLPIGHYQ